MQKNRACVSIEICKLKFINNQEIKESVEHDTIILESVGIFL